MRLLFLRPLTRREGLAWGGVACQVWGTSMTEKTDTLNGEVYTVTYIFVLFMIYCFSPVVLARVPAT